MDLYTDSDMQEARVTFDHTTDFGEGGGGGEGVVCLFYGGGWGVGIAVAAVVVFCFVCFRLLFPSVLDIHSNKVCLRDRSA